MNETRFLKTVTFGGYDKTDTDQHIKSLYARISRLESELRVTKFSLEQYRKDTEPEQILQTALAEEREKLAEAQSQNESMSMQIEALTAENAEKEKEIANLKYSVAELEQNLSDADMKIMSMSEKDDAAVFGAVFAAAKKSASEIVSEAERKSADLDANSKKLAENIIAEANNKAADIVYEAEVYAAEMTAEVDSTQLEKASDNIKSAILEDVSELSGKISKLRQVFEELKNYGDSMIQQTENMLAETQNTLIKGGMPTFSDSETSSSIDLPEKPVYESTDYSYDGAVQETNFDEYDYGDYENVPDFDELEEVDILSDDDDDFDLSGLVRSNPVTKKSGINFDSLDKQAEEFMNSKKPNLDEISAQAAALDNASSQKKKSGSIGLAELVAQAAALDDDSSEKTNAKTKSGGIDLATLAAQAAALDE